MSLAPGVRFGTYEVLAAIGSGGMGEVYRAHDTKLHRDVALKVLPDLLATDPDRRMRFQREAQLLASLNHPNIASIHGFEEAHGIGALVLELVEGPTLADRLARGALPLDEALPIARQIVDALEAAHEHGIVHRDLKPSNVKLRPDGTVKVLDFGLAKLHDSQQAIANLTHSPTVISPSIPGAIVGTAAYMPPEQAKGRDTDRTADVWAFGCVLYEILTGRRTFAGESVGEILAEVFKGEPDWGALPPDTPEAIRRLLRRCLRKDRKLRLRDIADARIEIDEALTDAGDARVIPQASRRRERMVWLTAVAIVTAIAIGVGLRTLGPVPSRAAPEMRLEIATPPTSNPESLAISPDGRALVFVATSDDRPVIWLRPLASSSAKPLAGTDFASYPFWSPDSRSVGFFADGTLKRIDIEGESIQALAPAANGRGGTWNVDGTILFAATPGGAISRVSASGGAVSDATRLGPQQASHRAPHFLPDGRHFLYYVTGAPDVHGVYVAQLDGTEARRLLDADAAAEYVPSGYLLFVRQRTLFAQNFDPVRLTPSGNAIPVSEQVLADSFTGAALSASRAGPLVYRAGSESGLRHQFVWFDRSGKRLTAVGSPDGTRSISPSLSPDGRRLALHRTVASSADIWVLELGRGVFSRLTSDPANDIYAVLSPAGSRVVFSSNRNGQYDLYQKSAFGIGIEELILETRENKFATDWSPDGRSLLYRSSNPQTGLDIWALSLEGNRKSFPVVQTSFEERDAQFSPDGKWIAYQSNESGRIEVYVQPFPGPGGKTPISTSGGAQPRWRPDGKELFYIGMDGRLMAAAIRIAANSQVVEADAPVPLFAANLVGGVLAERQQYVVAAEGQRFLVNTTIEDATAPITVILNWNAASVK